MKKVLLVLLILISVSACKTNSVTEKPTTETGKLKVVTTLYPFYDFLQQIAGDKIDLHLLLKPGIEAHSYEPTANDIIKINAADLFVYTSKTMEPWAESIITSNTVEKISLDSVVELISANKYYEFAYYDDENQTNIDPHFWLSLNNDIKIVDKITQVLVAKDVMNKSYYEQNAQIYKLKLQNLQTKYQTKFTNCKQSEIISSGHNVFAYLAKDYQFEVIAAQNLSPNSEITPQKVKELIDLAKTNHLKYVFTENLASPKLAETLASELPLQILLFNHLANLSQAEIKNQLKFIDLMTDNLNNLLIALECE